MRWLLAGKRKRHACDKDELYASYPSPQALSAVTATSSRDVGMSPPVKRLCRNPSILHDEA
jgi:hypothetical protein